MLMKPKWKTVALLILILPTLLPSNTTIAVTETSETKWVLDHVIVGESGETRVPDGDRFEGSFDIWDVSQSSINYHYRHLDHFGADDFVNAVYEFSLPVFPAELVPGQTVEVSASGSGSGYMRAGYFVRTLEFRSDDVDLTGKLSSGEEVHGQFGPYVTIDIDTQVWTGNSWATTVTDVPNSDTVTVQFKAPSCDLDQEFSVLVFIWNSNANVEWVYRCEVIEPEYGVIEKDGKLYLNSPPDGTLRITMSDLPLWARHHMVTNGSMVVCVGFPDTVSTGDPTVLLEGFAVARLEDSTTHGGVIVEGSDRIFINGVPAAFIGGFHTCPMVLGSSAVPHVGGPIIHSSVSPFESYDEWIEKTVEDLPVTILSEDVKQGSTILKVDGKDIEVGDTVMIGNDPDLVESAIVIDKGSLILDRPLKNDHPAGTLVTRVPDEYAELVLFSTEEEPDIIVDDPVVEEIIEEKGIPGFLLMILLLKRLLRRRESLGFLFCH